MDIYLIPPLPPHFICIFLLFKLLFPSYISKSGGYSPNGMGSKLVVCVVVCLTKNQNRIPRMFAGWDPFWSSCVEGKEKHRHLDLLQALGQSLSFSYPDPGFPWQQGDPVVVYDTHGDLEEAASVWTTVWGFVIPFTSRGKTHLIATVQLSDIPL